MKIINVRFERDDNSEEIEIIVRASQQDAQVSELIERLTEKKTGHLTVLDSEKCPCVVEEADIIFISSEGKQMRIITEAGIYTAKQSLQSMEKLLGRSFLRISRFELVNLRKVRKYDFTIIGTLRIEFKNGMGTWASRRYIPLIKERLSGEEEYLC